MKLYIPSNFLISPADAPEGVHVMTAEDATDLQQVMEHYGSFKELKKLVKKDQKAQVDRLQFRHPYLDAMGLKLPGGAMQDTLVAICNAFGDYVVEHELDGIPSKLDLKYVEAKVSSDLNLGLAAARKRVQAVENARFVKIEWGTLLFPTHLMRKEAGN